MKQYGLPSKQGLYDPRFEHDACGIGFVANIKGKPSHEIIKQALTVLLNIDHRGGQGSESNTGDGAGILMQIPHKFFKKQLEKDGFTLPEAGDYGVGMLFLPQDEALRRQSEAAIEAAVEEMGQTLIGWRTLPTDNSTLGKSAIASQPYVRQIFIGRHGVEKGLPFERKLYVIRKLAEKQAAALTNDGEAAFYFASMSSRTIVYKGMLTPEQVDGFYQELQDPEMETAIALVHSRFSTNTFPSWERAHPYRYMIHNGEINTLRGNVNWMKARQAMCDTDVFGEDFSKVTPIVDENGSDSQIFDNTMEFLMLSGRSLPHAAMMMIPEPWQHHDRMDAKKKAFYEYHSCLMEPWDGPAAVCFTDGTQIGALLDRNGLRPARYYVTKDDMIILSSEVGVLEVDPENVIVKDRLYPGRMLLVDTAEGRIISDEEVKSKIVNEHPYDEWLKENYLSIDELPAAENDDESKTEQLLRTQMAFGYTFEHLTKIIQPMAKNAMEPTASMGVDVPLAVLSKRPQMLYNYFKQLFAQVTNPPIDAIREEIVTSTFTTIGPEGNLIQPTPESCKQIKLPTPILSNQDLARASLLRRER